MPTVTREITIDASRAAVWEVLADIGSVSEWNPVVDHSVGTSEDMAGGIGASRHCDLPGSMGAIEEVVTAWEHEQSQTFRVSGAKMMREMHGTFDLFDDPDSPSTRVRMTADFTMQFGPIGALMAATMGKRMMAANIERTLAGLKTHVEADRATARSSESEVAAT